MYCNTLAYKRPEGVEIDPVMYTKSNRKLASANSLAWFPSYFCFRFRLQGLPNAIFCRFSTFRRRLACVVPGAMLRVPFLGTLPVGVTPPTTPTTPSVKEYQTRLRALGCSHCYIYIGIPAKMVFPPILRYGSTDFSEIWRHASWG